MHRVRLEVRVLSDRREPLEVRAQLVTLVRKEIREQLEVREPSACRGLLGLREVLGRRV